MTALKVIGIILLILLLLLLLRVGVEVRFGDESLVKLRVGFVRRTIVPAKKKKAKKEKKKPESEASATEEKKRRALPRLALTELTDLAATIFAALGTTLRRTCRRLRIDPLEVYVIFGGSDPADIAEHYGYASAAMWALMPRAEELFNIPDPSLHLRMDYDAPQTKAEGTVGLSFRIVDLFAIGLALIVPLAKWLLRYRRAHAHDAPQDAATPDAAKTEEKTEKLSA